MRLLVDPQRSEPVEPRWWIALAALSLALSLAWRAATWFERPYALDDFFSSYVSWLRAVGARPGVDFDAGLDWPLAALLAPLFGRFPESLLPLDLARAVLLASSLAVLGAVVAVGRRLGAGWGAALLGATWVSWQPEWNETASDLRGDGWAALALLTACCCGLGKLPALRWVAAAGLASGIACGISLKTLLAVPLLAALAVRWPPRRSAILAFGLAFVVGAGILLALRGGSGRGLEAAWSNAGALWEAVRGGGGPGGYWLERARGRYPAAFALLAVASLASLAGPWVRRTASGALPSFAPFALGAWSFVLAQLALNPFLYPYLAGLLVPLLGPLLAAIPTALARWRLRPLLRGALLSLAILLPLGEGLPQELERSLDTNLAQRRFLEWLWRATDRDERVFDWVGMHLGRSGIYHWFNYSGLRPLYDEGRGFSVADELRRAEVTLVLDNYRLAWLGPRDRAFFARHYQRLDHCIFVPGVALRTAGSSRFELLLAGRYRWTPAPPPGTLVDGEPAGEVLVLGAGEHRVDFPAGREPVETRLVWSSERRERAGLPCAARWSKIWPDESKSD